MYNVISIGSGVLDPRGVEFPNLPLTVWMALTTVLRTNVLHCEKSNSQPLHSAYPFHCTYVMYVVCFDFLLFLCIISLAFHLLFGPRAASLLLNWVIDQTLSDAVECNAAVIQTRQDQGLTRDSKTGWQMERVDECYVCGAELENNWTQSVTRGSSSTCHCRYIYQGHGHTLLARHRRHRRAMERLE